MADYVNSTLQASSGVSRTLVATDTLAFTLAQFKLNKNDGTAKLQWSGADSNLYAKDAVQFQFGTGTGDFAGDWKLSGESDGSLYIKDGVNSRSFLTIASSAITLGNATDNPSVTAPGVIYANGGVDRSSAATLSLGVTNANAVTISKSGVTTTVAGALTSTQNFIVGSSAFTVNASTGDTVVTGNLTVSGTSYSVSSEQVLISDNHLYLNNGYTTASAQSGGLVVNYLPTATADTVAAAGYTAGVADTSNPTVITAGSATFTAGDFIQISGCSNPNNNGLFEVQSHVGTTLTIRGIGTNACVEDFTQNQFTALASASGAITQVGVSVLRADTGGRWEVSSGNNTGSGLVFRNLVRTTESDAVSLSGGLTVSAGGAAITGNSSVTGTFGVSSDLAVNGSKFVVTGTSGNTAINGTLGCGGDFAVNTNKFTVAATSGNTSVAGTLGVTSDLAVNSSKFTVTASSGNTAIDGTLGVANDFAVKVNMFTVASASGNTLIAGTLGVTGLVSVGTSGITASSGSALVLGSATVAPKVAVVTTAERNSLTAANGMLVYNSTTGQFEGYDDAWGALGAGGSVPGTDNISYTINQDNVGADEDAFLALNSGNGTLMRQGLLTMKYSGSSDNGWNLGFDNTPAATDYGFGFYFVPTSGGAASGATAGGQGGQFYYQGGSGGAAGAGAGLAGAGGPISLTAGTGGMGGAGATDGAVGGGLTLSAGSGGMAAGGTAGSGGNTYISGGNGASGSGLGASLYLYGGGGGDVGAATLAAKNIDIGASAVARTVNLATGGAAQLVTVGSTNGASSLTLQGGSAGVTVTSSSGTLVLNGTGQTVDLNSGLLDVDASAGINLDGSGAASYFKSTAQALTIQTLTSGTLVVDAVAALDINAATATLDSSSTLDITSGGDATWTVKAASAAALTLDDGTNNYLVLDTTAALKQVEVVQFLEPAAALGVGVQMYENETLSVGSIVYSKWDADDSRIEAAKADADGGGIMANVCGVVVARNGATGVVQINTHVGSKVAVLMDAAPATTDNGKAVYLDSTAGRGSLTAPSAGEVWVLGMLVGGNGASTSPHVLWQPQFRYMNG